LDEKKQDEILNLFKELICSAEKRAAANFTLTKKQLEKKKIADTMRNPEYVMNNADKYIILSKVLELYEQPLFPLELVNIYEKNIIKNRNKLAHSKIDVTDCCGYLRISDNWTSYITKCDCKKHCDTNKISEATWTQLAGLLYDFNKVFTKIRKDILRESP
jgi:hypothetical protein